MPECTNPLWPCAMTGAAAALAGFDGITVVIHGSSGCYYYPATLLRAPLQGTFILEEDVVFGSEQRLLGVIREVSAPGTRIAVVTTCVPSVIGEDVRGMLSTHDVILVDSPGISGDFESGYHKALGSLSPRVDDGVPGINIDGCCLFDPFSAGNVRELTRLLNSAGLDVATVFCADTLQKVSHATPLTIGTNSDLASGVGRMLGGTLGFHELSDTFEKIGDREGEADIGPVMQEIAHKEEHVIQACDKYLRRFDPPRAVSSTRPVRLSLAGRPMQGSLHRHSNPTLMRTLPASAPVPPSCRTSPSGRNGLTASPGCGNWSASAGPTLSSGPRLNAR